MKLNLPFLCEGLCEDNRPLNVQPNLQITYSYWTRLSYSSWEWQGIPKKTAQVEGIRRLVRLSGNNLCREAPTSLYPVTTKIYIKEDIKKHVSLSPGRTRENLFSHHSKSFSANFQPKMCCSSRTSSANLHGREGLAQSRRKRFALHIRDRTKTRGAQREEQKIPSWTPRQLPGTQVKACNRLSGR